MTLIFDSFSFFRLLAYIPAQSIFYLLLWVVCTFTELFPKSAIAESLPVNWKTPKSFVKKDAVCPQNLALNHQISSFAGILATVSTWINQPNQHLRFLFETFGADVLAFVNRSPWPNIHEQAKLAKVPIMMYHDILPQKQVSFDVTPGELEQHFQLIKARGITPISLDQLMTHLQTGLPLPAKPILLTFDDGYGGHYEYVYPLLKKYGYPAVFSIYIKGVGNNIGRSHVSWEQLKEMVANPLVTIASHSVTHPNDLTKIPDEQLRTEVALSKQILEAQLGVNIRYFTYPVGKYDDRVARWVSAAGYQLALTMSDTDEKFAGESASLLAVSRFGQSRLKDAVAQAWGGAKLPPWKIDFDFTSPVQKTDTTIDQIPLVFTSGGKPITIHASKRDQLTEIVAKTGKNAIAAVDGGFFSLKSLDSNVMIGPVFSQITNQFIPGNRSDNQKTTGRPLVLISPHTVRFIPFDPSQHNTLAGIRAQMPDVTDAFVAAAWLVKDGQPQAASTFNGLYGFEAARYRAFWGINQNRQPTLGVSRQSVDSVSLGIALAKAGLKDAVMLDSGQSTSLVYQGKSQVDYVPRPVPHAVALVSSASMSDANCIWATYKIKNQGT
ncbi:polysaccharide deacetylase family protein [Fortiea contorta]|uniref:polysaccharide deacetylase family protein n=1 Tax=Fortiea contorta TaxID=1892405 RepID=UPI0003499F85|nr:polysaccharide deacetylase family protein [Fortiea contorta]